MVNKYGEPMLKLTYIGHSAFLVDDGKTRIIIDPFITKNPQTKMRAEDIKVNYIALTHAHGDHFGDTIDIAKNNNAEIIAVAELASYCSSQGLKSHSVGVGGSFKIPSGGKIRFAIAHHSSSLDDKYMGDAVGIIVTMDSKNIYHCGDTGVFYDMKLIGEMTPIDVMLVPIGDMFTMDIEQAVKAVELCNPKIAVPIHYYAQKTDPTIFVDKVNQIGKKALVMQPGETMDI